MTAPKGLATAISIPADASGAPEIVEFVRGADAIGIDCCWVQSAAPDDIIRSFEAVAGSTRSMRLGTGVLPVGSHSLDHVAAIAQRLAHIAEGRLVLGLGTGAPDAATSPGRLVSHLAAVIEGLRHRQAIDATFPIHLGALSPRMLRLTGEAADGWLASTHAAWRPALVAVQHAAAAAGRAAALDTCVPVVADAGIARALEAAHTAGATSVRIVVDGPTPQARLAALERAHAVCVERFG